MAKGKTSIRDIEMEMQSFDWNHADHMFIIPQENDMRLSLLQVDRDCREEVRRRFGVYLQHDWEATTIAVTIMEFAVTTLERYVKGGGDTDYRMNFFGLLEFYLSIMHSDHGEKEGNINIVFTAGQEMLDECARAKGISFEEIDRFHQIREDRMAEKVAASEFFDLLLGDNSYQRKLFVGMENSARLELGKKYNIVIPNKIKDPEMSDFRVIGICYTYLMNLIDCLISGAIIKGGNGMPMHSINFCDVVEMKCVIRDQGPVIRCTPGYSSKLIVKGDDVTDGDDYSDMSEDGEISVY